MAETTFAEPSTQVIPDIDFSPTTSGTLQALNDSGRVPVPIGSVGLDGRSPQRAPVSATPDILDAEWRDVTPEPFQSPSEWSAQQRAKWRAEDEQRIQQDRRDAAEYDRTIRDIDAATPKKGNSNPRAIGRAVASASAGVTGVMEAIDRRGNGAGWGETIGAGIGAVVGSLAGTAAGSAAGASAGAATTANPVGAKVGLGIGAVLGEQVGGVIGAEIGAGIGAAIDNLFPGQDGNESGADDLSPAEGEEPVAFPEPGASGEPGDYSLVGGLRFIMRDTLGRDRGFIGLRYGIRPGFPEGQRRLYVDRCDGVRLNISGLSVGETIVEYGVCFPAPEQEPQTRPQPQPPTFPDAPAFRLPDFDFPGLPDLIGDRPPKSDPGDRPQFEPIGAPDTSLPEFPDIPGAEPEPAPRPEPQPSDEPLGDIPGGSPQTGLPDGGGGGTLSPTTQPPGAREIEGEPVTSPNPIFSNPPGPVDFPSTGDGLEPIDDVEPPAENEQPQECDPCQLIKEFMAKWEQEFAHNHQIYDYLEDCDAQTLEDRELFDSGQPAEGLIGLGNQNVVIFKAIKKVWDAVKCGGDVYASLPDSASFRVPSIVPQLTLQFKEANSSKGSRWHITIPRFNEAYKDNLQPFTYQKGNYRCGLELTDNSKIIVNAITEAEGRRVIAHCAQFVLPEYLTPLDWMKVNKIPSRDFKEVQVVSCYAKYFAGRLDEPPQWVRKIR